VVFLGVVRTLREQILLHGTVLGVDDSVDDAAAGIRRFTAGARLCGRSARVCESEKGYTGDKRARAAQDHAKSMHLRLCIGRSASERYGEFPIGILTGDFYS
jgi:hypothetical protein